jgi:hypothetical protein
MRLSGGALVKMKSVFLIGLVTTSLWLVSLRGEPSNRKPIKVLVLNFDPVIEAEGSKRLHEVFNWHDPRWLAEVYSADLRECSGGFVRYQIVEWRDLDVFPVKVDGFSYDDETYLRCWREGKGWHLKHLPKADGIAPDGKWANWWKYVRAQ